MADHIHIWWHYWLIEGERVWDDPFKPMPERFMGQGYACLCGEPAPR